MISLAAAWTFLRNPLTLAAIAVIAAFLYGRHVQAKIDNVAGLEADKAALLASLDVTRKMKEAAEIANGELSDTIKQNEEALDALRKELATAGAACSLTPDQRLRVYQRFPRR